MTTEERFFAKVEQEDCWNWLAAQDGYGYGVFWFNGRLIKAHRASYQMFVGPIPDDHVLDHLCGNRRCVNPSHLEPVSRGENTRRGQGWIDGVRCKRGHDLSLHSSRRTNGRGGTKQYCLACNRARLKKGQPRRNRVATVNA